MLSNNKKYRNEEFIMTEKVVKTLREYTDSGAFYSTWGKFDSIENAVDALTNNIYAEVLRSFEENDINTYGSSLDKKSQQIKVEILDPETIEYTTLTYNYKISDKAVELLKEFVPIVTRYNQQMDGYNPEWAMPINDFYAEFGIGDAAQVTPEQKEHVNQTMDAFRTAMLDKVNSYDDFTVYEYTQVK